MDMELNDPAESEDTNGDGDGEGVWSPDIEECFQEALRTYPPCGRRKHIIQDEGGGKMYGRNELIARYILLCTGKKRTRKQVSSHIQVLARRKAKGLAASSGDASGSASPASLRAPSEVGADGPVRPHQLQLQPLPLAPAQTQAQPAYYDVWMDRPIVTHKIRLVEFSAFIEHRYFQPAPNGPSLNGGGGGGALQPAAVELAADPDLSLPAQLHHQQSLQMPAYGAPNHQSATHPLASNHHLSAQFNQATSYQMGAGQHQPQHQHQHPHQHPHQHQHPHPHLPAAAQAGQPHSQKSNHCQPQAAGGFLRHSYIQIDYTHTLNRQPNKLERIDLSQLRDKFRKIGDPEDLFQRGPSDAFFLVKFWADLNNDHENHAIDDQNSFFGFSSHFETLDCYKSVTCSTKVCSYGHQVVEKVEKLMGAYNSANGRYSYSIGRSPMCEFMIQFIKKLRQLPRTSQMNSVLENFSVLQVITSGPPASSEILLCLAYFFEVAPIEQNNGPQCHVYKLTRD